jgi:hypothetical protein
MAEGSVMRSILLRLGQLHFCKLFRNQVGTYKLEDGRYISSGLCEGSSDLIGWTEVIVTPEMVGKRIALFTAIEVKNLSNKRGGRTATKEQRHFIREVEAAGGIAGVARTEVEAAQLVVETVNNMGAALAPKRQRPVG